MQGWCVVTDANPLAKLALQVLATSAGGAVAARKSAASAATGWPGKDSWEGRVPGLEEERSSLERHQQRPQAGDSGAQGRECGCREGFQGQGGQ